MRRCNTDTRTLDISIINFGKDCRFYMNSEITFTGKGSPLANEIARRRTFAIISHPDAGKTTLTEKFLLYGGAIQSAGSVKGKQSDRHAVSDWMEMEKKRGISITSSVMQFEYEG